MSARTFVSKKAELEVDGSKLTLAPLTLHQIQRLKELNEKSKEILWTDYLEQTTELIWESAKVSDGSLTLEALRGLLTVDGWNFALTQLTILSGMTLSKPGENQPES